MLEQSPRRIAVFSSDGDKKNFMARLTLLPEGKIQLESHSEQFGDQVKNIIASVSPSPSAELASQAVDPDYPARRWQSVADALKKEGLETEDISAGDYQIKFEIDIISGRQIASQTGLHSFANGNDEIVSHDVV